MASENAAGDVEQRRWLANLHFDPNAREETPVGFNQRPPSRQIDYVRYATRAQARSFQPFRRKGTQSGRRAPFQSYRASHVPVGKLNSRMRVRAVAPRTRTANWLPRTPHRKRVPEVAAPAGLKLSSVVLPI